MKDIEKIVTDYSKETGYDLVLTDGVLYASDKVDITETVLQKLHTMDKESGKPVAPGKAPAN